VCASNATGVVVTGMGVVCSIGTDVETFAAALRAGRSGAELRGFALEPAVAGRESLPGPLRRRALSAGRRAPLPVQASLGAALEAWESSRLHDGPVPPDQVGLVVAGNNLNGQLTERARSRYGDQPLYLPGRFALHQLDTDHVGTLSQVIGIAGEGFTVGAASASGNVGIISASRLVEAGAVRACLVVGALTDLSSLERQALVNIGALADTSGDGARGPFDRCSPGFVYGQGAACLVLEPEESARRRGATILAGIAGYDLKLDGNSLADPREDGEAHVIASSLRRAGVEPGAVSYVNAHGTGSALGDEVELRALRRALGGAFSRPWLNSTKALTGHCLSAAGVLEAVATIVQMRGGFVHPTVSLRDPIDPAFRFVGPRAQPAEIRFAVSNGFGFGGFNTSVTLASAS
jgi:malonyl-[acp] decarboxylase